LNNALDTRLSFDTYTTRIFFIEKVITRGERVGGDHTPTSSRAPERHFQLWRSDARARAFLFHSTPTRLHL